MPLEIRLTTSAGANTTICLLTSTQQQHQVQIQGRLLRVEADPNEKLLLENEPGAAALHRTLVRLKTDYAGLSAAVETTNWPSVDTCARNLRDGFRQLLLALESEKHREGLLSKKRLDARAEFRLAQYAELKPAIESMLLKQGPEIEVRRLMNDLAKAADEVHHALREQKPESVSGPVAKLKVAWEEFARQALN